MTEDGAILEVEDLSKRFGGVAAVDDATLSVRRGSITALIGPNGAGKTTLFNVVTGFLPPDGGRVAYDGKSIAGRSPHVIARRGMVRTFQITKALSAMSVIDNMMLAAPNQPGEKLVTLVLRPAASRKREKEVRERALGLLDTFGLADKAEEYAGTLSGGQRKLLDEPMAGINPTLGKRLLEHMAELRESEGVTFLFIEHDMDVVMGHSDRVIVMAQGQVIADDTPDEVRRDKRVIEAYLGGDA